MTAGSDVAKKYVARGSGVISGRMGDSIPATADGQVKIRHGAQGVNGIGQKIGRIGSDGRQGGRSKEKMFMV